MPTSINHIYNFRQAAPNLATSGQPSEEELVAIAAAGYTVIINLALHDDPRYSLPDEASSVKALGLEYVHIPVRFNTPTENDLTDFFHAMKQHRESRVWLHCAANKRVTAFLGLYRHLCEGWSQRDAFALMHEVWQPDEVWSKFIALQVAKNDAY